jgi:hypothetical protein
LKDESGGVKDFEKMIDLKEFHDIDILVGKEKKLFRAHRVVLCVRSKFFNGILSVKMSESIQNRIELPDIISETFEEALKYIYLGKIHTSNLLELLRTAEFLGIDTLVDNCSKEIVNTLKYHNMAEVFGYIAYYYPHHSNIISRCCNTSGKIPKSQWEEDDFVRAFSKESLILLLKSGTLTKLNDMDLFKGKEIRFFYFETNTSIDSMGWR